MMAARVLREESIRILVVHDVSLSLSELLFFIMAKHTSSVRTVIIRSHSDPTDQ